MVSREVGTAGARETLLGKAVLHWAPAVDRDADQGRFRVDMTRDGIGNVLEGLARLLRSLTKQR